MCEQNNRVFLNFGNILIFNTESSKLINYLIIGHTCIIQAALVRDDQCELFGMDDNQLLVQFHLVMNNNRVYGHFRHHLLMNEITNKKLTNTSQNYLNKIE